MKKFLVLGIALLSIPAVLAGYTMWYNMSFGKRLLLSFFLVFCFVIASFVFSIIFWLTRNWLENQGKKKKR